MKTILHNYRIIIEKERQNKKEIYVAYAPTLGVSDFGETIEEATTNIENAMRVYIETLVDVGETVPNPDTDDYFITTRKISFNPTRSLAL
jgi:predicted RNase H-like HicB family nuclease